MERLEQPNYPVTDVLAGVFTYTKDSVQHTAEFYVRCEPRPERSNSHFEEIKDRRNAAANDQLTDTWNRLDATGCSNVHYVETKPDPFV